MFVLILAILGLSVGSFLNVCIFRIPKEESVVFPASHCQSCQKPLQWFDNIPVISFIMLRGKCRYCSTKISWQYTFVEMLSALLFIMFYLVFGFSVKGYVYLALSLVFIVVTFIDIRHQIIPDVFTLPGIVLGVLVSGVFPTLHHNVFWWEGLQSSALGLLIGGGVLYIAGMIAEFILKKEAMGGGDVKFLAMIGAFCGWQAVLWTVFSSSLIASLFGMYLRLKKGQELIPYGPYLAAGAFIYFFYGERIIRWYLGYVKYHP